MSDNITLGRGRLLFQALGSNGFRYIGNTPAFGVSVASESLKHYNSDAGIKKQDREVPIQTDYSGSFTTDNIDHANMAALLQGSTSTVAVAGSTGETITFTGITQGLTYQVGDRNLANVVVKVAAATKALGTDYTVDAVRGHVTPVVGGGIANAADMIVEYDITAHSIEQTVSGAAVVEGSLMFVANNPEGEDIDYYMGAVKLTPNGEFNVKAEEWQAIQFNVLISEPSGGNAILANGQPYTP